MNKRKTSLDNRTVKKRKKNKNPGSLKNARSRSETRKRISRGLKTKEADKDTRENRLKKMWAANECHQKAIKYPQALDSILVIEKKYLDMIFSRIKTLECRNDPLNYLDPGDVLYLQETTKPGTIRGYVIFEGYIEFESQAHFQRLSNAHRVFDQTLEESGYTHGYKFSKPHEYDEVIRVESTGQQRKLVRKVY